MSTLSQSMTNNINCTLLAGMMDVQFQFTYTEILLKYTNDKDIDTEALELTNDASMYLSLITEDVLVAKKEYLKFHKSQEEKKQDEDTSNDNNNHNDIIPCKFEICYALQKLSSTSMSLNGLNELEQAHLIFSHSTEFDKYRRINRRASRDGRYAHNPLSNDVLNKDNFKCLSFFAADLEAKSSTTADNHDDSKFHPNDVAVSIPKCKYITSSAGSSFKSIILDPQKQHNHIHLQN